MFDRFGSVFPPMLTVSPQRVFICSSTVSVMPRNRNGQSRRGEGGRGGNVAGVGGRWRALSNSQLNCTARGKKRLTSKEHHV